MGVEEPYRLLARPFSFPGAVSRSSCLPCPPSDPGFRHVAAPTPIVAVRGLRKRFGGVLAVDGLGFEVRRGECFGLLGPNGAGKSTTLRLMLGLLEPDEGSVRLLDQPVSRFGRALRARVGVVPQSDSLDPDFTVAENLQVFGRYFGIGKAVLAGRIEPLLAFAGLEHKRGAKIAELSGGMRRRLTLARALINDPEILFLDEPTTGLDPQARHLIWERLRSLLAAGKTIVLTTHHMEEAERLCDRVTIIDRGVSIAEESPARLIAREIEPQVLEVSGEGVAHWLGRVSSAAWTRSELVGDTAFLYCTDGSAAAAVAREDGGLRALLRPANLEDVFLKLTGRDLRD